MSQTRILLFVTYSILIAIAGANIFEENSNETLNGLGIEEELNETDVRLNSCIQRGTHPISIENTCRDALNDERTHLKTFYSSLVGLITASFSATLSAISSLVIIIIIWRSSLGFSTVYHRIMFGMSVADFLASIGMAFGTLPMPADMIYEFEGSSIGNQFTCNVQGLLILTFIPMTLWYNMALFIYHLCSIRYRIDDDNIQKCIEPILHLICIFLSLPVSVMALNGNLFNPTPYEGWCTVAVIPHYCFPQKEGASSCIIRGKLGSTRTLCVLYMISSIFIVSFVTLFSMGLIIASVYRQKTYMDRLTKRMKRVGMTINGEVISGNTRVIQSTMNYHAYTRVVVVQGFAYILAFFICQWSSSSHFREELRIGWGAQIFHSVCRPLQGFFHFLIFVGQKAYDNKRFQPTMGMTQAIIKALKDPNENRVLISSINLVSVGNDIILEYESSISSKDEYDENGADQNSNNIRSIKFSDEEGISYDRRSNTQSLNIDSTGTSVAGVSVPGSKNAQSELGNVSFSKSFSSSRNYSAAVSSID